MSQNKPIIQTHFREDTCRHIADGKTFVLHCHHFASLTTQLANDCSLLDAKKLLKECAEDSFYEVLTEHFRDYNITDLRERIREGERYFAECGLGKLEVKFAGHCAGEVLLRHSHVDEGWLKKWGKSNQAVNHIGCGYVTALFSAIFDRQKRRYNAYETESIACGAEKSIIKVTDAADVDKGGN